ncbi:integrase [Lactobacillus taiwanensis]|uniref:integrase n=1 Tax=Lactobacillus taiwanensis TaxID=508451 RepID=UPI0025B0688B|nr:integrase [Lactobacillus taiwanensis]
MYRGDTFVDLGTADYLAEKYHKKKESLLYLARPVAHRKAKPGGTRVLLYRIED